MCERVCEEREGRSCSRTTAPVVVRTLRSPQVQLQTAKEGMCVYACVWCVCVCERERERERERLSRPGGLLDRAFSKHTQTTHTFSPLPQHRPYHMLRNRAQHSIIIYTTSGRHRHERATRLRAPKEAGFDLPTDQTDTFSLSLSSLSLCLSFLGIRSIAYTAHPLPLRPSAESVREGGGQRIPAIVSYPLAKIVHLLSFSLSHPPSLCAYRSTTTSMYIFLSLSCSA